ncbi:Histidine kinase [Plasmodiophora brassicae]
MPCVGKAAAEPATVDYHLIFQAIPTQCVVLDLELRIVAASDAYLEATMTRKENITGRYLFDVFPDNPSDPSADGVRNLRASLKYVLEHRKSHALAVQKFDVRNADGLFETKYWSGVSCPVLDPNTGGLVNIIIRIEDVTELIVARGRESSFEQEKRRRVGAEETIRRMECEVLQRAEQVQQQALEMEKMNAELTEARDKAIEASNSKSTLVATISHELRTPLTGIVGFTDLLSATPLSDDQTDLLNLIGDSARVLHTLVNDLLDVSKLEAGKVVLEQAPFLIRKVVSKCQHLLQGQAQLKSLPFRVMIDDDVPVLVRGDSNRLRQVLTNLLNNAIKFTDAGGVTLNVSRVKARDAGDQTVRIRFQIADSGIGIDQQDLASLFTPFFQVDSSDTRRYGGTGLGLHIVKTLIEMMNGHIGVQSVVDQGSVFCVDIPFGVVDHVGEAGRTSVPNPGPTCDGTMPTAGTRVLVVDDNEIILRLVSRQLFTLGCRRVLLACNGKEAVSKFETSGPVDLILMDCQMPELDGCGATIALRNIESRSGNPFPVPIIAMTASAMYRDREMCLRAGMNDVLAKPFTVADLASVLHKWL